MATLGASGSSNTSPRWGRTGEPGSAFSGLSRGRGRGRGGAGGRGGRGRLRGGLSTKDFTEADVDVCSTKPDNSQSSPSPLISPSVSTPAPGKPNGPPSKPKPASRRGSRAIPVTAAVPQINKSVETASAPAPPKLSHKRRRSQAGKPALHVPPKANLSTLNDSPIRTHKLRLPSESHSETLKDLPPHLNSRFDVRNDIDALVERVRAVAMDNRPSTPKNHIDWAVDDDDTLPDLDDWGVTTTQLEVISPIIVDGLRPLPEFAAVPSPLKQVEADMAQPIIDARSSSTNGTTSDKVVPPSPRSTKEEYMKSKISPEPIVKHDPRMAMPLNSKIEPPQSNPSKSLHPSLPTRPLSVDSIVQHISKLQPRASPMRTVPYPQSPITPMMDLSGKPQKLPATNSEQTDAQESIEVSTEMTDRKAAIRTPEPRSKGPEHLIIVEPTMTESVILNVSSDRGGPDAHNHSVQESSPSGNIFPSGLGASMHAPKGIVDSISAPANLSTYADFRARDPIHTHTRAHTVGRSFPDSAIQGQGDYMSRFTRSGHTTPRVGIQGNNHARTHSTPPGGANHRSPQMSRPVITGDAISRLARTIGQTHNNLSPPKSHSAVTFGN
ncbi:hypothetical protein BYT27DRAFT_7195218 [Phlegmacium glaucopus]|nr:hypothetical protein BYT27DRAFT_7195218 [Phlegmacium glaucopus]